MDSVLAGGRRAVRLQKHADVIRLEKNERVICPADDELRRAHVLFPVRLLARVLPVVGDLDRRLALLAFVDEVDQIRRADVVQEGGVPRIREAPARLRAHLDLGRILGLVQHDIAVAVGASPLADNFHKAVLHRVCLRQQYCTRKRECTDNVGMFAFHLGAKYTINFASKKLRTQN